MPYLGKSPTQAVRARYYYTASSGDTSVSGSDDNSNTLIFSDGEFVDVSLNGVTLVAGTDYVTSTANTIGSLSAMSTNDVVEVVVYDVFSVFDGNVNSDFSVGGDLAVTGTTSLTGNTTVAGLAGVGTTSPTFTNTSFKGLEVEVSGDLFPAVRIERVSGSSKTNQAYEMVIGSQGNWHVRNATAETAPLNVNADGSVTMNLQPAFLAQPASQQNNVSSDDTIAFGTEIFDQNADFASNTFTAPVTGKYQLSVALRMDNIDAACDYFRIGIHTSNRNYFYLFEPDIGTSAGQDITRFPAVLSILADMDASDTATVVVNFSGGTAQTDIITDSYFSGFLAC